MKYMYICLFVFNKLFQQLLDSCNGVNLLSCFHFYKIIEIVFSKQCINDAF